MYIFEQRLILKVKWAMKLGAMSKNARVLSLHFWASDFLGLNTESICWFNLYRPVLPIVSLFTTNCYSLLLFDCTLEFGLGDQQCWSAALTFC